MSPIASYLQRLDTSRTPEPLKHPIRGLRVLLHDIARCDLLKQASAMAYVTLLSLIPSLVAIFCVLSLFSPLVGSGTSFVDEIKDFILENLAEDTGESVVQYLEGMLGHLSLASLGWSSFASVLVTLILLLRQIEEALNRIWLVHKGRNIFARFMSFWTFLTLGVVVVALLLGVTSGFDFHELFGLTPDEVHHGHKVVGWLVGLGGAFLFFFFLYKVVPNCYVATRSAAVGALLASVLLTQGGQIYGMYVQNAKNYATLYGALAQLPIFLTWLYICWIIIMLGALVSWRFQEGFPKEEEDETLDAAALPLDRLRNVQVKAALPLVALVSIYKHFQHGTGHGVSAQQLAHALRIPVAWVAEAVAALGALGYVVAAKQRHTSSPELSVTDPFFPAYPAESVAFARVRSDLGRPLDEWLTHWHHDLALDLRQALQLVAQPLPGGPKASFAEALATLPAVANFP
jgi:membrane protein